MPFNSLRTKLLAWTMLPLSLLAVLDVAVGYLRADHIARLVQENQLLGSARVIAEQVRFVDGNYSLSLPPAALELFDSAADGSRPDQVYYRVTTPEGNLLSGYYEMAQSTVALKSEQYLFFPSVMRDEPVHVVAFAQPVFAAGGEALVRVEVGQTLHSRKALASDLWRRSAGDHLMILGATAVLILLALQFALAPLLTLRRRMAERQPGVLTPLDAGPMPSELQPLVAAMNDYIARLGEQMAEHDRFIGEASHQLRTPLTVFNTQVSYALRQQTIEEKDAALRALRQGLRSNIRLVAQLLAYTEADAKLLRPGTVKQLDLLPVIRQVLEELALVAQEKQIDLGYEGEEGSLPVRGTRHQLAVLLSNLVDNAIRYTPSGGIVTVRTRKDETGGLIVTVEDNGPGIPEDQREHVFERFYRLHGEDLPGSGLGLAIVREIARSFGIALELSAPPEGSGTVVRLTFPPP